MLEIYKFGGTCMANTQTIRRVTEIIKSVDHPVVVALSAASGVTNQLKDIISQQLDEEIINHSIKKIRERHEKLLLSSFKFPSEIDEILKSLERLLYGIYYTEELTNRTRDLVLTFGERLIALITREYLKNEGLSVDIVKPEDIIRTDGIFGSSLVLLDETISYGKDRLEQSVNQNDVVLVPGFYGVSNEQTVTVLGRSGTDYTATVLAYMLDADSVTIWKDVHGFMSADPRLVEDAFTIPFLSYAEAAELAYFGAALLHPRAASPARIKKIPIYIRHIDDEDSITCINGEREKSSQVIKSVSHMTNLAVLKVYATVGGNTRGVLASMAKKITEAGSNTISVATSQTTIAFLMKEIDAFEAKEPIKSLGPAIVDNVEVITDVSLICIVGEGLGSTPGIASRVFEAVAKENINVDLISAGASSTAYHFTVSEKHLKQALLAIHDDFF